ncbi:hypothetical protein AX14_009518 [Amanita brunnescens Koide BX004]|nr:hypothetical protein AX14_009518 [Amanita brunnescens Koide BX004]
MDAERTKRQCTSECQDTPKKKRFMADVCEFLDIEASDGGFKEEEGTVSDNKELFIDDGDTNEALSSSNEDDVVSVLSHLGSMNGGSEGSATDGNDRRVVDYGLGAIIDCYEEGTSAHPEEDLSITKEVEWIAEHLMRMPTSNDPDIWRVQVRDGTELESFYLLNDRLQARPCWAISVLLPPASKHWICVEPDSRENVEQLCLDLSMFPHPLQIHFVPVEERTHWLGWRPTKDTTGAPRWSRFKRRRELQDLCYVQR